MNEACRDLPEGYHAHLHMENGCCCVELFGPDDEEISLDLEDLELDEQIAEAVFAAKAAHNHRLQRRRRYNADYCSPELCVQCPVCEKNIRLEAQKTMNVCSKCFGTGIFSSTTNDYKSITRICNLCGGSGRYHLTRAVQRASR